MRAVLVLLTIFLSGALAHADIYRYLDDEGVECFTDAPTGKGAVRVMKETPASRRPAAKKEKPRTAAPAPIAENKAGDAGNSACDMTGTHHDLPIAGRITSTVGLRHDPIDGMIRDHKGVDIATPEGTPVRPVAPGVVVFSGCRQGYGNTVMVRHDDGMVTLYAHNSINLKTAGEPVDRGSTIAFSGSTGRTTGPHLHFEAWKDGVNITSTYIPGAPAGDLRRTGDGVRRYVQADGTLVFTNLP